MITARKHAFLIIAHNNIINLKKLISLIDHPLNDIFIHIDAKWTDFNFESINNLVLYSKIYFTEKRIDVRWGTYTIVEVELLLFETALNNNDYLYFHLLSGADLPIRKMDKIQTFFLENKGWEFVTINDDFDYCKNRFHKLIGWEHIRVSLYWIFPESRREKNIYKKTWRLLITILALCLQKIIFLDRRKINHLVYGKGSQWVSITNEFVKYILKNKKIIKKAFQHTYAPDEHFIQSLILSSDFKDKVYSKGNMRFIDWNRGNPYTFRSNDFKTIMESNMLFARKFDASLDLQIINKIDSYLRE